MAAWRDLPLTVLHTYRDTSPVAPLRNGEAMPDDSTEQALVAESLAGMQEKFPEVEVHVRLARGYADHELITASRSCDLLVIGHHPISALDDLIHGSVAPVVVEHAHGAVAVVPATSGAAGHEEE
jgi:nucleotide-binding universal stress UspA family protein